MLDTSRIWQELSYFPRHSLWQYSLANRLRMEVSANVLSTAHEFYARANTTPTRPPVYKAIGISLAVGSGLFIGTSFVLKKTGLLRANVKYKEEAGEGYGYLKNAYWWTGMTLMIVGEICNFVAYSFVDAILVTPLGALSVVVCTILSAIFLKERLSFVGKVGCFMCIVGSVVIVMNAPAQSSVTDIQEMKHFVIAPGFLTYAGVIIIACIFIALWVAPRYGKKSMMVYLSICSLIGGLSVVATQGLGSAVVAQANGEPQFNQWFLYFLFVFVITTLVTEIIFLNVGYTHSFLDIQLTVAQKALNIFNAALVTPTYYVFFTSATIVTSAVLFRGFKGTPTSIVTVVLGFLQICAGVVLLQLSKSAKDVPDAAVFKGDLDQVRTVAEQEEPESEPKADAIRGAAAIVRRFSTARQKMEAAEAKRVHEERLKDQMEPIGENEQVEWDGLKRRKTVLHTPTPGLQRTKTLHPPLGMTHFPNEDELESRPSTTDVYGSGGFNGGFMDSIRKRAQSTIYPGQRNNHGAGTPNSRSPMHPVALTEIAIPGHKGEETPGMTFPSNTDGAMEMSHVYGLPPGLERRGDGSAEASHTSAPGQDGRSVAWSGEVGRDRANSRSSLAPYPPPHSAKRQFSFQNVFHRHKNEIPPESSHFTRPTSRKGHSARQESKEHNIPGIKSATEEERCGLVKGDSTAMLPLPDYLSDEEDWQLERNQKAAAAPITASPISEEKEVENYQARRQSWEDSEDSPELLSVMSGASNANDRDAESRHLKDWEGRAGGSGGGAFV